MQHVLISHGLSKASYGNCGLGLLVLCITQFTTVPWGNWHGLSPVSRLRLYSKDFPFLLSLSSTVPARGIRAVLLNLRCRGSGKISTGCYANCANRFAA